MFALGLVSTTAGTTARPARSTRVQDWLAQFIVSWHQNTGKLPEAGAAATAAADIDATLAAAPPALAALVPALHALLRCDPLSPERGVAAADGTRALLLLWASLAPPDLLLCMYPMLVAVENVEHVEPARCPLSLASLQVSLRACMDLCGSSWPLGMHIYAHMHARDPRRVRRGF